jgi:hypothetical protein
MNKSLSQLTKVSIVPEVNIFVSSHKNITLHTTVREYQGLTIMSIVKYGSDPFDIVKLQSALMSIQESR